MSESFNLVDREWIPVRALDGQYREVSLAEAMLHADRNRAIEDESPLVVASLYRLLLAVLHRAVEGPESIRQVCEWYTGGFPQPPVESYLAKWHHRFDLFDKKAPFYQVAAGQISEARGDLLSRLMPTLTTETNARLFDWATKLELGKLTPARAARLLVAHQSFALGGLMRQTVYSASDSPVARCALVLAQGANLSQTLALNLVTYSEEERVLDSPCWERSPTTLSDVAAYLGTDEKTRSKYVRRLPPAGITDRYTWLSRLVFLEVSQEEAALKVKGAAFDGGLPYDTESTRRPDPMVRYRVRQAKDGKTWLQTLELDPSRALWRDFEALIPRTGAGEANVIEHAVAVFRRVAPSRRVSLLVCGMSADQQKIGMWRQEQFHLPPAVVEDVDLYAVVQQALQAAEQTGYSLNAAATSLASALLAAGGRKADRAEAARVASSFPANALYWSKLGTSFSEFLSELTSGDPKVLEAAYHGWCKRVADAADSAWRATANAVGRSARALRGVATSEGPLRSRVAALRRQAADHQAVAAHEEAS